MRVEEKRRGEGKGKRGDEGRGNERREKEMKGEGRNNKTFLINFSVSFTLFHIWKFHALQEFVFK